MPQHCHNPNSAEQRHEQQRLLTQLEQLQQLPDSPLELTLWVSDTATGRQKWRQECQRRFPEAKIQVYRNYKTLLHFVLDQLWQDWQQTAPKYVSLHYSQLADAPTERLLLEAYPLAGMLQKLGLQLDSQQPSTEKLANTTFSAPLGYLLATASLQVINNATAQPEHYQISWPCRQANDLSGATVWRQTAGIWWRTTSSSQLVIIKSDLEQVWDEYTSWLQQQSWPQQAPFFERLSIQASLPTADELVPFELEHSSLLEALSEELYFGTLEFFAHRAQLTGGSRNLQLGQVVPKVQLGPAALSAIVEPLSPAKPIPLPNPTTILDLSSLKQAPNWEEIESFVQQHGAQSYGRSVQGRHIWGRLWLGENNEIPTKTEPKGLLISAGQHANENTGIVAALQALQHFSQQPPNFPLGLLPLENPDGYVLHRQLCQLTPQHMHHAARYTALGDDLGRREVSQYETQGRSLFTQQLNTLLHLNLHGYPAHEWTRPLSGYLPRGFADWTLPKGFMLIFRFQEQYLAQATSLSQHLTATLAKHSPLLQLNRRQLAASAAHSSARPYRLQNGIPLLWQPRPQARIPLEIVSEFPDETIYESHFKLGQMTQWLLIEATLAWWQTQLPAFLRKQL